MPEINSRIEQLKALHQNKNFMDEMEVDKERGKLTQEIKQIEKKILLEAKLRSRILQAVQDK